MASPATLRRRTETTFFKYVPEAATACTRTHILNGSTWRGGIEIHTQLTKWEDEARANLDEHADSK